MCRIRGRAVGMYHCGRVTTAAVLASMLLGGQAPGSSAQNPERVLEEVIVTAQMREQVITEVPLSMQAFSDNVLESINIRDLSELITLVPGASEGLSVSMGQRQYQMRGISTNNLGDPTIGYYIDDAAFFIYGEPYAPIGRAFDIQRVEVLRGPQSTLYGNGSMGGTIRYITEPPSLDRFTALVRGAYSSTDGGDPSHYVDGMLSIPLLRDQLGLRLAGGYEQVGGYHEGISGESDTNEGKLRSIRTSLLWEPGDKLEVKFLYVYNKADQDGSASLSSLDPPIGTAQPGDYTNRNYGLYSSTVAWDSPLGRLSTTSTWIDNQTDALFNTPFAIAVDGNLMANFATDGDAFNNETRLVSTGIGPTQWLVGVFYSDTSTRQSTQTNLPQFIPDSVQHLNSKAISLFGEISREFMDGTVVPLVGVRFFDDDRDTSFSTLGGTRQKETFDSINPRFNLSIHPDDNTLYYANIAKGFRSGNFNNPDICAFQRLPVDEGGGGLPCEDAVDSDELWSYEAGAKLTILEGQLSVDAAAYYEDWSDVREAVQYSGLYQDYQVGDAEIYGLDLSIVMVPAWLKGFTLLASANVNSAEYTHLKPAIEAVSGMQEGDRLPLVPEWTMNLTGNYSWSLGGGWLGQAAVGYSHIAKQYGQFGTTEAGDSRDLLRVRVGADNEHVGLWLFGSNLLAESGAIYVQNPASGLSFSTQDYPRQIGVEASYRY